jgi:gas vesicle protein
MVFIGFGVGVVVGACVGVFAAALLASNARTGLEQEVVRLSRQLDDENLPGRRYSYPASPSWQRN